MGCCRVSQPVTAVTGPKSFSVGGGAAPLAPTPLTLAEPQTLPGAPSGRISPS